MDGKNRTGFSPALTRRTFAWDRASLLNGMSRDGDSYAPHWRRWADQEDRLFAAEGTRARADLVIDTG